MSTGKQTADEYEKEIRKLKNEVKRLETSKCELMVNTANEMDRLRAYIKFITNKNSSLQSILDEIPNSKSPFPLSIESNISNEVKSNHSPSSEHYSRHSITTDIGNNERDETLEMKELMDKNHDIIADMEKALDEFISLKLFSVVKCKCTKPTQLQFIATMDEPNMKCKNCDMLYASMFKCNICNMSICSECQKYIAEMQCLRSVMQHFKYPKQFQIDNDNNNNNSNDYFDNYDRMSQYERYEEYGYYNEYEYEYDDGFSVANQGNNRFHGELMKLGTQMHLKASDKLEYIFEEDLLYMTSNDFDKIDHQTCYQILDYLDDVDLCYIIDNSNCVSLLQIYWQLFEYHLTYDTQLKQFKKLRLLMDCNKWENDTLITMQQRIIKNGAKEYIIDKYLPNINDNRLMKPKLLYDDNDNDNDNNITSRIITESNNVYHNYYINEQLNEGFGNKVIKLLRIIIDNEEYNNSQITFERLKHKKYGQSNQILANGIYYIWHCHGLNRSFALQEQIFSSYQDAIDDEDEINLNYENNENQQNNQNNNTENSHNDYDSPTISSKYY